MLHLDIPFLLYVVLYGPYQNQEIETFIFIFVAIANTIFLLSKVGKMGSSSVIWINFDGLIETIEILMISIEWNKEFILLSS